MHRAVKCLRITPGSGRTSSVSIWTRSTGRAYRQSLGFGRRPNSLDILYAPNEYKGWRRAAQSAILSPKMVSEPALVVYTRPDCSYSDALLHDLDKDGVAYRQVDLEERPDLVGELERLTGGERMTPVMVEGDLVIVGYHGVG